MEMLNLVQRDLLAAQGNLRKVVQELRRLGMSPDLEAWDGPIQGHREGFETVFKERLDDANVTIAAIPTAVSHTEIARRAMLGQAPYSAKDKDSYRDTLIWLTVLDLAKNNPSQDIWLVSANVADFGVTNGPSASALPSQFHSDLSKELTELGLIDRVKYATKLELLQAHLAAEQTPVDPSQLTALVGLLSPAEVWDKLDTAVAYRPVKGVLFPIPGLRPAIVEVIVAAPSLDSWQIVDASLTNRGWAARFVTPAKAVIAHHAFTPTKRRAVLLSIGGVIRVGDDGQVDTLDISSVTLDEQSHTAQALLDELGNYVVDIAEPQPGEVGDTPARRFLKDALRNQDL